MCDGVCVRMGMKTLLPLAGLESCGSGTSSFLGGLKEVSGLLDAWDTPQLQQQQQQQLDAAAWEPLQLQQQQQLDAAGVPDAPPAAVATTQLPLDFIPPPAHDFS